MWPNWTLLPSSGLTTLPGRALPSAPQLQAPGHSWGADPVCLPQLPAGFGTSWRDAEGPRWAQGGCHGSFDTCLCLYPAGCGGPAGDLAHQLRGLGRRPSVRGGQYKEKRLTSLRGWGPWQGLGIGAPGLQGTQVIGSSGRWSWRAQPGPKHVSRPRRSQVPEAPGPWLDCSQEGSGWAWGSEGQSSLS